MSTRCQEWLGGGAGGNGKRDGFKIVEDCSESGEDGGRLDWVVGRSDKMWICAFGHVKGWER